MAIGKWVGYSSRGKRVYEKKGKYYYKNGKRYTFRNKQSGKWT